MKNLEGHGIKRSTIQRTINIGRAAISRAFKRGELAAMPFIVSVRVKSHPPKGRPMEAAEIARLYARAPRTFGRSFAGRPALRQGRRPSSACAASRWKGPRIVRLNPEGREQNKKHRPIVRLPQRLRPWFSRLVGYVQR